MLLLAIALLAPAPARACGGEVEGPLYVARANPDLPLSRFTSGNVGLIPSGRAWDRGFLVVAYRGLTGVPLEGGEHAGFVRYLRGALRSADPRAMDPSVPLSPSHDDGSFEPDPAPWRTARVEIAGGPGPAIVNGWNSSGGWTPNCLADAFSTAAATLRDREARWGARSADLASWIEAQDAVFSNCGNVPGRTPASLPDSASEELRHDRDYQLAAAAFYAGHYEDAERRFRAIAADEASPWAVTARYLVVRTLTRAAQRGREHPDRALLDRASAEARALLADAANAPVFDRTLRYQGWLDTLRDPGLRARDLGVALASPRGDLFEESLRDYTQVLASTAGNPFERVPGDPDRLTTWIAVLEGQDASLGSPARTVALELHARTRHPAWLVAALLSPGDARDPRLTPLLAAAASMNREDPAYVTARYHRLRIARARGDDVYAEAVRVAATLRTDDGPSARNAFRELAMASARDLEAFLAVAHGAAAAEGANGSFAGPAPSYAHDEFSPAAAATLSRSVPLSTLLTAARATTLPAPLRERLAVVSLVRATLLDDDVAFMAAAALTARITGPMAAPARALAAAQGRDARHFEAVRALLDGTLPVTVTTSAIDFVPEVGDAWAMRCTRNVPAAVPAAFLSTAERSQLLHEHATWGAMTGGSTYLAAEAARLATALPHEQRMPTTLAAAVAATRNNYCETGAPIHAASQEAFRALHRLFPRSPEARNTRYWY